MTLVVSGHTALSGGLDDCKRQQHGTEGAGQQVFRRSEPLLDVSTAGTASEAGSPSGSALPTARGSSPNGGKQSAASSPTISADRECCQDNSCSPSTPCSHGNLSQPGSSHTAAEVAVDDDTGFPTTSLASESSSSHLHRLSSSLGSLDLDAQLSSKPVKPQATSEPLLEDNDDRFCLFPIKYGLSCVFIANRFHSYQRWQTRRQLALSAGHNCSMDPRQEYRAVLLMHVGALIPCSQCLNA